MKNFVFVAYLFTISICFSQETSTVKMVDSLFREDQFYASISYNLVQNTPIGFKQFSFSPGVTVGFLRDFPFTKSRKWAVAPGFGYNYNNIKQFVNSNDLFFGESSASENIRTTIITHLVDFPLELRWRSARPDNHKFWRIYLGFKASYVLKAKIKFEVSTVSEQQSALDDVNKWQYGTYLGFGYNTWNPYIYYGLNPIFKDGYRLTSLNFGFIFYIL